MKLKQLAGAAAALLLALSIGAPALADTSDHTDITLNVLAGTEFSVQITDSKDFNDQAFSLGAPGNYTAQAWYNLQVVDMRGTGAGWNVSASASAFSPAVPTSGLVTANNGPYWSCMNPAGYCYSSGSITNGVGITSGSPDIIAGAANVISSTAGHTAAPQPNGTGTFSTNETLYFINFPNALQVGTYSTTVTLTLTSAIP